MFTGFLLGEALGGPGRFGYWDSPGDVNNYYYGDPGYYGDDYGGGDFGGGDFAAANSAVVTSAAAAPVAGTRDNFGGGDF